MSDQVPFVCSAPGKVIIFGEHAAVFGKPAIAAAVSLKTYLLVSKNTSDPESIVLDCPDIGFHYTWKRSELPWDVADKYRTEDVKPTDELIPELVSSLTTLLSGLNKTIHYSVAYSFIYLYTSLCNRSVPGLRFTVRSTLPIGAGLGSSASVAVCLVTAFALLGNHIQPPTHCSREFSATDSGELRFIDSWAFMGEKCIHGNPSGIDNAVATHGGAVMFQRMNSSIPSVRTSMRNFPTLKLLLINTKHPRRTADLVANVSRLVEQFPKTTNNILDGIEAITREGYNIIIRPFFDEAARDKLRKLIELNHGLLVSLGVSHPSLERIRILTDSMNVGKTKLTGAGGGGCAITLLNDDVDEEVIHQLSLELDKLGCETFETTLGGKGVGYYPAKDIEPEQFLKLNSRQEIETVLAVNTPGNWKYW